MRRHLKAVVEDLRPLAPRGTHFRVCVDTAPLLEREIAARAGLGFLGKNGLLIVPGLGSHVVLGEILTDAALAPTAAPADPGRGPLRDVHGLPRRLPDGGLRRAARPRRPEMHLVSHDRETDALHAGGGGRSRRPPLRLRRLPGRLSVQRGPGRRARGDPRRPSTPRRSSRLDADDFRAALLRLGDLAGDAGRPRTERAPPLSVAGHLGDRHAARRGGDIRPRREAASRRAVLRAAPGRVCGSSPAARWRRERRRRTRSSGNGRRRWTSRRLRSRHGGSRPSQEQRRGLITARDSAVSSNRGVGGRAARSRRGRREVLARGGGPPSPHAPRRRRGPASPPRGSRRRRLRGHRVRRRSGPRSRARLPLPFHRELRVSLLAPGDPLPKATPERRGRRVRRPRRDARAGLAPTATSAPTSHPHRPRTASPFSRKTASSSSAATTAPSSRRRTGSAWPGPAKGESLVPLRIERRGAGWALEVGAR